MFKKIITLSLLILMLGCGKEGMQDISKSVAPPPDDERSVTTYLGDFTINLKDPQALRILQMTIAVESSPEVARKVEENKAKLRDSIVIFSSEYTAPLISGFEGKMNMKDELHWRINNVLSDKVDNLYFTRFAVGK
jgi:flagellar basal body-associated protein FliL